MRRSLIAILDYTDLPQARLLAALEGESSPTQHITITNQPDLLTQAERIVLPTAASFSEGMIGLHSHPGLLARLIEKVCTQRVPLLAIGVGLHLLATRSLEAGTPKGLDWLAGEVCPQPQSQALTNSPALPLARTRPSHPLAKALPLDAAGCFLAAAHFVPTNPEIILATTTDTSPLAAVVADGHIAGTQFQPELSDHTGRLFLRAFLNWIPT